MTLRELLKTVRITCDGVLDIVAYSDTDEDFYDTFGFTTYCYLNELITKPEKHADYMNEHNLWRYLDCEVRGIECTCYGTDPYLRIEVAVPDEYLKEDYRT